jgi:hypothetical protein
MFAQLSVVAVLFLAACGVGMEAPSGQRPELVATTATERTVEIGAGGASGTGTPVPGPEVSIYRIDGRLRLEGVCPDGSGSIEVPESSGAPSWSGQVWCPMPTTTPSCPEAGLLFTAADVRTPISSLSISLFGEYITCTSVDLAHVLIVEAP